MEKNITAGSFNFHAEQKNMIENLGKALLLFLLSSLFVSKSYSQLSQSNENYFAPAIFNNEKPKFHVTSEGAISNSKVKYSISASSPMGPGPSADLDQIRNGATTDAGTGSG